MIAASNPTSVVSQSRSIDQDISLLGRLWYADPTGETAVLHLLEITAEDLAVVDPQGHPVFLIRKRVLIDAVIPHLTFTRTRRGRDNIRAHRKAPVTVGAARGDNQNPTLTKEN